jgi:hypothetical protein
MTIAKRLAMALAAIVLISGLSISGPASAQTISYAQAVDVLGKACGADIGKYCKGINLGNGMFACLDKNEAKVSQTCKATAAATIASLNKRAAAQEAVGKICASDLKRFCKEYDPGRGRYLRCLLKTGNKVSGPCSQAITDAGWR